MKEDITNHYRICALNYIVTATASTVFLFYTY